MRFFKVCLLLVVLFLIFASDGHTAERVRIMPVGDSITEGGDSFSVYRPLLWEKLLAAGYDVEFVGSKKRPSRFGDLAHEGYGGKDVEFLASVVPANFEKHPADIVLLQAGHNHDVATQPVPGMIAATEQLISSLRAINPKVTVLVAQVIPSSKLPKYSYIPDFNSEIAKLAARLNTPEQPVLVVDQADGFDPVADVVADKVHPNPGGAEKMAEKWFQALARVLPAPAAAPKPEIEYYESASGEKLPLHIFRPEGGAAPYPAIVYFFGGGWSTGTPLQFYQECSELAAKGYVAISADYRIASTHGTAPADSMADGQAAIGWVRKNAAALGVDPKRIIAAGASAGGQVAAAAGILPTVPPENRPDALVLLYPVLDNGPDGYGPDSIKSRYQELSPFHNVTKSAPPTLLILGSEDPYFSAAKAADFRQRMEAAGVPCTVKIIPGGKHPLFRFQDRNNSLRAEILSDIETFAATLK
jgi:acetyl esterase/lipase